MPTPRKPKPPIVVGSIFGAMADPGQWGEFSCIKTDGSGILDQKKYAEYMRTFAHDGASATREIPWLVDDRPGAAPNHVFMPWIFREGRYGLHFHNQTYFDNLRKMARIANFYRMTFYFSAFDRCHGLLKDRQGRSISPWKLNHQGIDSFYGQQAWPFAKAFLEKVLDTLKDTDFGIEIVNEPFDGRFPQLAVNVMQVLRAHGVPHERIILGLQMVEANGAIEGMRYKRMKDALRAANLYEPKHQFHAIHQFGKLHKFLEGKHRGTDRWWLSDDGDEPKLNAPDWEQTCGWLFNLKGPDRYRIFGTSHKAPDNVIAIEHLYRFVKHPEKPGGDDIRGCAGISRAIHKVIDVWPSNWLQFPPGTYPDFIGDNGDGGDDDKVNALLEDIMGHIRAAENGLAALKKELGK